MHRRGPLVLDADDFDVIRHAIRTLGLERIEEKILEGLSKADPRSLMALLLANLRNLRTLYAEIPKLDMFFMKVLRESRPNELDDDDLKWDHTRGEPAEPPHSKVAQACKERGIMHETKLVSRCINGGHGCQYYRYVRVSRARAGTRRRLRKNLKLYLERRRGWARDYRDRLVYRDTGKLVTTAAIRGLSTEELDTYELEWDKLLPEEEHIYDLERDFSG